jgi:predicted Zn-dependent protease
MKAWIAFSLFAAIAFAQTKPLEAKLYALGASLRAEILRESPLLEIPEASALIQRLAAELDPISPAVSFELVRSNKTEIFVLPGGFALIPARLLLATESEADLARHIAHAIAHIRLAHGVGEVRFSSKANMASIPIVHIGGWEGIHRNPNNPTALPTAFRAKQEQWEREADIYASARLATRGRTITNTELNRVQAQLLPLTISSKAPSLLR